MAHATKQYTGPQAIPTRWNGVNFRSRLEARWAMIFDLVELDWQYEPEGLQLPSGWYVPDFCILEDCGDYFAKHWIEIKPAYPSEKELIKAAEFALTNEWDLSIHIFYGEITATPDLEYMQMSEKCKANPLLLPLHGGSIKVTGADKPGSLGPKEPVIDGVYALESNFFADPIVWFVDGNKLLSATKTALKHRFW